MACMRTQGKKASPVAGSVYSGWCWCQTKATFSGVASSAAGAGATASGAAPCAETFAAPSAAATITRKTATSPAADRR